MRFTKMHGAGNDYVYVDCFQERLDNRPEMARKLADRHFGVGGDGLICICPSETADVKMDMYNQDGSQAEMCGNGIRCVARYAYDHGLARKEEMTIETGAGLKTVWLNLENGAVRSVRVSMGAPDFRPEAIPVAASGADFIRQPLEAAGRRWEVSCLSVGNPHCVVFVEDPEALELPAIGPAFENHPLFPARINTEFVQVLDRETLRMRVWERGSGETLACGTGATAALCAAAACGYTGSSARLLLRGGELFIEWDRAENRLYMTGPAVYVFQGELLE